MVVSSGLDAIRLLGYYCLLFFVPSTSFQHGIMQNHHYDRQRRGTTRLYQDSVLQEWWKESAASHHAPSGLDWGNKIVPRHWPMLHINRDGTISDLDTLSTSAPQEDYRIHEQNTLEETTAPGLGTFEFVDDDEEYMYDTGTMDALSSEGSSDHVLSQRNRTHVVNGDRAAPKLRSVLDTPTTTRTKKPNDYNSTRYPPPKKQHSTKAKDSISSLLPGRRPTDVLTLADMERILKAQLVYQNSQLPSRKYDDRTAFPQPSILSPDTVRWGTTVAGGCFGLTVSSSALPNLWLVGAVAGSLYGHSIPADANHTLARFCLASGRHLARFYLQAYDAIQTIFFLFKTGQLSYTYYQHYQDLDQRFGIQRKMDAWNARFAQGKRNFDAWERENEIGRKVLATLRTAWLVEEKGRRRYRVLQYVGRLRGSWVTAIGSAVIISTAWAVVPASLVVGLTLVLGYMWPTWLMEFGERLRGILVGGDTLPQPKSSKAKESTEKPPSAIAKKTTKRPQYHSYVRKNGKRRYYRVGQSAWPWQRQQNEIHHPRWQFWKAS